MPSFASFPLSWRRGVVVVSVLLVWSSMTWTPASAGKLYRTPESDPLPARVRLVDDASALDPYESCDDLQNDVTQALRLIASNAILDTFERGSYRAPGVGSRAGASRECDESFWSDDDLIFQPLLPDEPDEEEDQDNNLDPDVEDQSLGGNSDNDSNSDGVDDFGTNNQVEGVEEADILQSDGTFVYAAYGGEIVVWDPHTGEEVTRARLQTPGRINDRKRNLDRKCFPNRKQGPWWWNTNEHDPHVTVKSLLLLEQRLVAVVEIDRGCTCHEFREDAALREEFVLTDSRYSLEVLVFDTSVLQQQRGGRFVWKAKREIMGGRYLDARSIGSTVHVVSTTTPNLKEVFTDKFFRHRDFFEGAREGRPYVDRATGLANKLIRTLSTDLVSELVNLTRATADPAAAADACSAVSKIVLYATTPNGSESQGDEDFVRSSGLLQSLSVVTSIDAGVERLRRRQPLPAGSTALFLPSNPESNVYASQDVVILSARGWRRKDRNRNDWKWTETTFLTALTLSSDNNQDDDDRRRAAPVVAAPVPLSVGFVSGRLVNQFAMDHYGNHLRVATTIRSQFECREFFDDNDNDTRECISWRSFRGTRNQVYILEFPQPPNEDSNRNNDTSKVMEEVGMVTGLGKPGESIFAVRFVGDVGYVVTFERTDPFYILDLSNPENPQATGELEISGFSNYLHPVRSADGAKSYILAVGEDADDRGRSVGVQISLFDVTDTANPTLAARHVVEEQKSTWSSSEAQWEHKAFRYVPDLGIAILPVSFRGGGSRGFYDGFFIYRVTLGGDGENDSPDITVLFDVEHANGDSDRCFSTSASLPSRSMVFDSNIMSVKRHSVQSFSLTGEELWKLDLDQKLLTKPPRHYLCGEWW